MAWIVFVAVLCYIFQLTNADNTPTESLNAVSNGNNAFTFELYKCLQGVTGNLVFSPLSVEIALAMVGLGASGNTATEIIEALRLPDDGEVIKNGFRELMSLLNADRNVTLESANKLYVRINTSVNPCYLDIVREYFASDVEKVNFTKEEAIQEINQWVEQKTRNKIKDLVPPGSLSSNTVGLLVNTLYFSGNWTKAFTETLRMPFRISQNLSKTVETMHVINKFKYAELSDLKAKVLQLDYLEDVKMYIILPYDCGLSELEKNIHSIEINQIKSALRDNNVNVYLPKFKFETSLNLKDPLMKCGMQQMFTENADFSHISQDPFKVDSIFQKAFIEVYETGTIAAAATGVTIVTTVVRPPPPRVVEFRADHPFIFLLYGSKTGAILFAGRVFSP